MSEKIHYDDFIEQVALESGFDQDTAKEFVEDIFETIVEESTKGEAIKIRDFGSFQPRWYKAKRGINPQTGEALDTLPHYHIHFTASKRLERLLNPGKSLSAREIKKPLNWFVLLGVLILVGTFGMIAFFMLSFKEPKIVETGDTLTTTPIEVEEPPKEAVLAQAVVSEVALVEAEPKASSVAPERIVKKALYPGSYEVKRHEDLTTIGLNIYEKSRYWPLIYTQNSSHINDPDHIRSSQLLMIPDRSDGILLEDAYLDVYKSYLKADKMSRSFWVLCEGVNTLGKSFKARVANTISKAEMKIVQRCSK